MKHAIVIPERVEGPLRAHLFQNSLEQGAFLFASVRQNEHELTLTAKDFYLVPKDGWEVQMEVYLQMKDSERAKIMKLARDKNFCAIDCHSHPHSGKNAWFSPSDVAGITDFAQYAKWKLNGKPFAALVWGERSIDGVVWHDSFQAAVPIDEVQLTGAATKILVPTHSWFRAPKGKHRFEVYE
jgi:hypothetical protein